MKQLDTENGDYDLTGVQTVLTHTPDAANPTLCLGYVALGDGTLNLDGTGGDFELTVSIGGQIAQPGPQTVTFGTDVRAAAFTALFPVPANTEVLLRVKSPNGADTDVDVTATLYAVGPTGALRDINLDHLMALACAGNVITGAVVDSSALALLAAIGGDISDYSPTTDSLEALSDELRDTGVVTETYTLTVGGVALEGATVWMTTDIEGTNVVASTTTDAAGKAYLAHNLASGTTVYIWRYKAGIVFVNPDTETST